MPMRPPLALRLVAMVATTEPKGVVMKYHVHVYYGASKLPIDIEVFDVGRWTDIGFWLDNFGYIAAGYRIEVTINDR